MLKVSLTPCAITEHGCRARYSAASMPFRSVPSFTCSVTIDVFDRTCRCLIALIPLPIILIDRFVAAYLFSSILLKVCQGRTPFLATAHIFSFLVRTFPFSSFPSSCFVQVLQALLAFLPPRQNGNVGMPLRHGCCSHTPRFRSFWRFQLSLRRV